MPKDNLDIQHEGDEFFEGLPKPNRETVKQQETYLAEADKKARERARIKAQEVWLSPENPMLYDGFEEFNLF